MIEISRIPTSPLLVRGAAAAIPLSRTRRSKAIPAVTLGTPIVPPSLSSPPPSPSTAEGESHDDDGKQRQRHQHQQQQGKRVTFASTSDESPSTESPLYRLQSTEQWKSLWYQCDELSTIKDEVYQTSRRLKRYLASHNAITASHDNNSSTNNNNTPSLSFSDETRGLEQRCCQERQRRKYLTIRYVLGVASLHHPAPIVAGRAAICSQWATQLALAEARRDYHRAYGAAADRADDDRLPPPPRTGSVDNNSGKRPRGVDHPGNEGASSASLPSPSKRMRS